MTDNLPEPDRSRERSWARESQIEYLKELSASLGFSDQEPWTEETFQAIDSAPLVQRRRAAIRAVYVRCVRHFGYSFSPLVRHCGFCSSTVNCSVLTVAPCR